jgi:hypothetical protein
MLTEHGKQRPLLALENTLLRASFGTSRARKIRQLAEPEKDFGQPVYARLWGGVPDCAACDRLANTT